MWLVVWMDLCLHVEMMDQEEFGDFENVSLSYVD
jgi:hypothetical protein